MDRATRTRTVARHLLLVAGLTCLIGMVGPYRRLEHALVPWDKAGHFIAFYGLTLLMFSAFPKRRRFDLAMLAVFAGSLVEVVQMLAGRDAELGDVLADACGAFAVLVPVWLEWARQPRVERRQPRTITLPTPEPRAPDLA